MANRFLKAAGGVWSAAGTWSATGAGGVDSVGPPTAADDCILELASGALTIDAGAVCRSINMTSGTGSYTGTVTHTTGVTLTIGDASAGAGNVALKFNAGATYTLGSGTTSAITFISTSATVQTVTYAGKTVGNNTFNGVGGKWQLQDSYTGASLSFGSIMIFGGTLDTNNQTVSTGIFDLSGTGIRTVTLGTSVMTFAFASGTAFFGGGANLTVTANTATANMTGGTQTLSGSQNYNGLTVVSTGGGTFTISGVNTFGALTRSGTATKTDGLSLAGNQTITGILTLGSNSVINRLNVFSGTVGTARTLTAATLVSTNVIDFMDITGAGAATWTTGASGATYFGDAGGNSGITFTTPATQTWSGTSGGNWSTNAWTTRVPLPQDDVTINAAFSGGQTVTADMPRLGASISWVGATGAPTWAFSSVTNTIFGSVTLIAGMTISGTQALTFGGRSAYTLTSAGQAWTMNTTINAPGGTYTLQDAYSGSITLTLSMGGFDSNNFNVTIANLVANGSGTRSLTMGTSIWSFTITSTFNFWNTGTTTGLTFSGASATIVLSTISANVRTFAGGGLSFGTLTYTVAGSTGTMTISGANTFGTINFSDASNARTLQFTAATTTTVTNFNVFGTAGKLMTIQSATAATHTLSKASGTVNTVDYVNLVNSIATGGAAWYAGANSTDGGGNTGWIFSAAPIVAGTGGTGEAFIFRSQRPSRIYNYVNRKDATKLRGTAQGTWRAYLSANGGTGNSIGELESTWLAGLGYATATAYAASLGYTGSSPVGNIRALLLNG